MKRQRVLVDDPHPKSMAALALLNKQLSHEGMAEWLEFRTRFLGRFHDLVCSHCGRTGLLAETEDPERLATVDHVVPVSKGGAMLDEANCVVACLACNNNRQDMDIYEYRRRRRNG